MPSFDRSVGGRAMKRRLLFTWIGMFLTTIGIVFLFSWSSIFTYVLNRELSLSPSSITYEMWKKTPVPLFMDIYLFNCTNTDQFLEKNYRPGFAEIGPYSFKLFAEKVDTVWNPNHTVTYREVRYWYFDHENSNGTLNDSVTMLNPLPVGASYVTRYWSDLLVYPMLGALSLFEKRIWLNKPVSELLFDGYTEPLLTLVSHIPGLSSLQLPKDRIGFFYGRNGSALFDGVFNMETGVDDITKRGILRNWNYNNHAIYYDGRCANIRGSVGELFPPGQTKNTTFELFIPDICRTLHFEYSEDVTVNGITGYRYVMSKRNFENGTSDPDTLCNCGGHCLPRGVLNVTRCRQGAPAFLSSPHFFNADPYYRSQISGMHPEADRHQFYVTLEPITGTPLDIRVRLQLNLLVQPNSRFSKFAEIPTVVFPGMWFETRATITPEIAASLKMYLKLPTAGFVCSIGLLLTGLLTLGIIFLPRILSFVMGDKLATRRKRTAGSGEEKDQAGKRTSPEENTLLHTKL